MTDIAKHPQTPDQKFPAGHAGLRSPHPDTLASLGALCPPQGVKPWEDPAHEAETRLEQYREFVSCKIQELRSAQQQGGARGIDPGEILRWHAEQDWAANVSAVDFCERPAVRASLGKNFLGEHAWRSQGIDIGPAPIIPITVTPELLRSECPLFPGQRIADTHILVLVPGTANGNPYSPVELARLCESRTGSGERLFDTSLNSWKNAAWASTPQHHSFWALLAKFDPEVHQSVPGVVDRHFRNKTIAQQDDVLNTHYPQYRRASMLRLATAMVLNDLVNGQPRLLDGWVFLRCAEKSTQDGLVDIGAFGPKGIMVRQVTSDYEHGFVGCALERIL